MQQPARAAAPPLDADGDVARLETISLDAFGTTIRRRARSDLVGDLVLTVSPLKGSDYVQCPTGVATGCQYTYNPVAGGIQWSPARPSRNGSRRATTM